MHAGKIHKSCNKICVHFYFLVEVLLLLLLRAAAAAHNISTEAERGVTFSFLVAALLLLFTHRKGCAEKNNIGFCFQFDTGTQSIAFSVVVVVDCAAVETGCMLEKYIKVASNKIRVHFYFLVEVLLLLLLLRAAAAAHNISTQAEKGITLSFLVAALLLLFIYQKGCAEKKKIGFCFLFDTGTQSIAFIVTGYVLLLFVTAPGSCLHQY